MNLGAAYEKIWRGKLAAPPDLFHQSIDRVNWVAELWREHFGRVDRLRGPLLDCGCGSGAMLAKAHESEIDSIGVDFSGPLADWLQSELSDFTSNSSPGIVFRPCDLNSFRLPLCKRAGRSVDDAGYQIITCCDVIEHLVDPGHLLNEIYRVLQPGGHAYISTPNCSYWKRVMQLARGEMFRTSGDDVLRDGGHLSYWGPTDLKDWLKDAGFSAVGMHYRVFEKAPDRWRFGEFSDWAYMIAVAEKR